MLGRIHYWNDSRGFGFIRLDSGGEDVYIHFSELPLVEGRRTIKVNTIVEFSTGEFRGRPCARDVRPVAALD